MSLYARDRDLKDEISPTNFKIVSLKLLPLNIESLLKLVKENGIFTMSLYAKVSEIIVLQK